MIETSPLEHLWSGWRSGYISSLDLPGPEEGSVAVGESVFARILSSGLSDDDTYIVHRGAEVFAILNVYPYSVGHLLVLPYRQIAELEDLSTSERSELWSEVEAAVTVLRGVLDPDGFNVGINIGRAAGGSVAGHVHVHVVPRWYGDANFMVTTASAKAISEPLDVTADRIRRAWRSDTVGRVASGKDESAHG